MNILDEIIRSKLSAEAARIRKEIGCPVLMVVGSDADGGKVIIGADIEVVDPAGATTEKATFIIQTICARVAAKDRPDNAKLYGEGRDS